MSLQTSRYESQNIVNSLNLFIDSERSSIVGHGQSVGDDVHIHMEGNSVEAMDGEIIRLSLVNFTMFNNLYHIDASNRRVRLRTNVSSLSGDTFVSLTRQNHKDYKSIVQDFAAVLGEALVLRANDNGATGVVRFELDDSSVKPSQQAINASNDRLLEFTITAKDGTGDSASSIDHNLTRVLIQCQREYGDSYVILGGEGIDGDSPTANSFDVNVATQTVTVKGYFPMQRMSDPYVYIRCENVSNGLEMSVLGSHLGVPSADVINSNILGKVFRDVEFIQYHAQSGDEYFLNLQQRRLSHIRLFLTDSKGRRLGRLTGDAGGTAAGRQEVIGQRHKFEKETQSTKGNLFFTACLKIEIIRVRNPQRLETVPPPFPKPAREAQSVVTWQDYGRPKH